MTNPLDGFLERDFRCDVNHDLKNVMRERTTRMLRSARWRRRLALALAAAACYLAGLATMWCWPSRPIIANEQPAIQIVIVEKKADAEPVPKEIVPDVAVVLEWQAHDEQADRAALFRKAGDLYYEQENDVAGALRCYTQALDAAGPAGLEFSSADNWLIMSLKNARRKERGHVE